MRNRVLALFSFLVIYSVSSYAQRSESPVVDILLLQGIDLTMRHEYDSAYSVFGRISNHDSENPIGFIFQAAVLQARSEDYLIEIDRQQFDSLLALAERRSSVIQTMKPKDAKGYFYGAMILGYESYVASESGEYFRAMTKAQSALSYYRETLTLDSGFTDCYAGLGTFLYWRSRKVEFLSWLPFVSDDRLEGIRLLKQGVMKGRYNRFVSANSLVIVLTDAEAYEEALKYCDEILQMYPMNRNILWAKSLVLEKWGKNEDAIRSYNLFLESIAQSQSKNLNGELSAYLKLAAIAFRNNDRDEAIRLAEKVRELKSLVLENEISGKMKKRLKEWNAVESHYAKMRLSK